MSERKSIETGVIGADTSFLVDFLNGEEKAVAFMKNHARFIRVSELVIYEFLCGNLNKEEKKMFFDAMQSFATVNFNREAAILSSELYRKSKKKGKIVGHQDCMIAGSYLAFGVSRIVTRNKKHFSFFDGVDALSY